MLQKIMQERIKNFKLNKEEFEAGKLVLKSKPTTVMLPITQECNMMCPMCVIDRKKPQILKTLSLKEFKSFQTVIGPAYRIALYDWGEPLMNPEYEKILDDTFTNFPDLLLYISSNGVLLTDHWINKFIGMDNLILNVSINAATRLTYKDTSGKDRFYSVIRNLEAFLKARGSSKTPILTLSYVIQENNILELPNFVLLASNLGVDAVIVSYLMTFNSIQDKLKVKFNNDSNVMAYMQARKRAESIGLKFYPFANIPGFPTECSTICKDPWESVKINSSGGVGVCCYSRQVFGNIFNTPFNQIWNSEKLQELRKTVNSSNPLEYCKVCPKKAKYEVEL